MRIRLATRLGASLLLLFMLSAGTLAANIRSAGPFSGLQQGGSVTLLEDGRIVTFGGGNAAIWDPEHRKWTLPADARSQPRRYLHSATQVRNDRIVFAGGLDTYGNRWNQQTALSSVTVWRLEQNIWEAGPGLLAPRFAHAAVALPNGEVLVIGGTSTANQDEPFGPFLASVERLNEKTTTAQAPMQFARVRHTATVLNDGRVMVIGGMGNSRDALASVEIYDAEANTWQPGVPLLTARAGHTATLLSDGSVLVAGGVDSNGNPVSHAELYSTSTKAWRDAGELLAPRSAHVATALKDGSVLFSGGIAYGLRPAATLERWRPDTNAWTVAGESPLELRNHHAALMKDGSVLLFGGDAYERTPSVLVWLPDEPEEQHIDSVINASLTDLEDGRVLLVGGSRRQSPSASVSLYDLTNNRWTAAAPLHFGRTGHRAIRLADGRVLIAGGQVTDVPRSKDQPQNSYSREPIAPFGEIYDPLANRWTVTSDISAIKAAESAQPEISPTVAVDTRWSGLLGIITTEDGKTFAFRNAELPGRAFARLDAVWLNRQARRWQPNTNDYVERESPAMLALSDTEIMVAGGATAVVQIYNTATKEWRYSGWLPAPLRLPSIIRLHDGGVMLAGKVMGDEATVLCALWDPEASVWSECGKFLSDSTGSQRAPILKDLGAGQTLLVYGNERALVRGSDGNWIATKLDFPKSGSVTYPNDNPTAYTANLGSVWNPLEQRWMDATDVLLAQRHNMQSTRLADKSWIFASRNNVLRWQPHERVFSRLLTYQAPESNLDSAAPLDDRCAILWNSTREIYVGMNEGAYAPVMYARNFSTKQWTSGIDAPTAPLRASALMTKGNTLYLAGLSRDDIAGGGGWQAYRAACDQVTALTPIKTNYLPTRPLSAPKPEPAGQAASIPSRTKPTYVETWKATVLSLADSARKHFQGTLLFGGFALLLMIRLSNRSGIYVVDDDGRTPGRLIDLTMLAFCLCVLLATFGAPWPLPRTLIVTAAALLIVFAANRLWRNIETGPGKLIYGLPLGVSAILCALAIGSLITSRLYAVIDSLRDY
jgi:N-acetylneuraminic acid mutarotase